MKVTPRGLWEMTAPPAPSLAALAQTVQADVAIVGAGVTGLSAALELARHGANVVVVEAADVGSGAIGRSSGLVNAGMWISPEQVRSILGRDHGDRLLHALGEAPRDLFALIDRHGIACDHERAGTLQCAVGASGLKAMEARARSWAEIGADVELLDAEQTQVRVGSACYRGALLDRRTGTVQPLAYVRGLASAAVAAGALIFVNSPAIGFEPVSNRWRVRTTAGEVIADRVLIATDTYAMSDDFDLRSEFVNLPYFNIATRPLTQGELTSVLPSRQAITDTRKVLSSYRLDRDGRLIIGSVGALSGAGRSTHVAWANRAINRLFPHLGQVSLDFGWYGAIGMTDIHLPAIHEPAPGILSAGGYNGRGIAAGTLFGRSIAEYFLGRRHARELPVPISLVRRARHKYVRGIFYEWGARVVHVADRF
ncbi:FAD-dependent oxidoreductase [Mesorhizobium loti]|nr:FAD-dependent oxidoreductase [Mesorhizobium loti]